MDSGDEGSEGDNGDEGIEGVETLDGLEADAGATSSVPSREISRRRVWPSFLKLTSTPTRRKAPRDGGARRQQLAGLSTSLCVW